MSPAAFEKSEDFAFISSTKLQPDPYEKSILTGHVLIHYRPMLLLERL